MANMGDRHFDSHRRGGFSGDVHHHRGNHRDFQNHHEYHHRNQHHHQQQHDQHHYSYHNSFHQSNNGFLAGQPDGGFGGGRFGPNDGSSSNPGRNRAKHHSVPDCVDGDNYVKLYVAYIPRTFTEENIRPLFEEHGNVVEIVLLKDKRTGQQQGACFVKYLKLEEADRAIQVLNNLQAFPGVSDSLIVRYADGEQERLAMMGEKLYVAGLNNIKSMHDVEEIFSPYGDVEDIYMVCDEMKHYRGYGFIKYAHRDMASAAINALNGVYIKGYDQPLTVRFAQPKKPKKGDSGVNSAFGAPHIYPRSKEIITRLGSNVDDHLGGGRTLPNAISLSSSSIAGTHPKVASHEQSPSCQPGAITKTANFFDGIKRPSSERCPQAVTTISGGSTAVLPSNTSISQAVLESTVTAAPFDCDWSEHTCPEGDKYYFNCITCESRWEKPDEYNSFEQLVMKRLSSSVSQQELKSTA